MQFEGRWQNDDETVVGPGLYTLTSDEVKVFERLEAAGISMGQRPSRLSPEQLSLVERILGLSLNELDSRDAFPFTNGSSAVGIDGVFFNTQGILIPVNFLDSRYDFAVYRNPKRLNQRYMCIIKGNSVGEELSEQDRQLSERIQYITHSFEDGPLGLLTGIERMAVTHDRSHKPFRDATSYSTEKALAVVHLAPYVQLVQMQLQSGLPAEDSKVLIESTYPSIGQNTEYIRRAAIGKFLKTL